MTPYSLLTLPLSFLLAVWMVVGFRPAALAAPIDSHLRQQLENAAPSDEFAIIVTFQDNSPRLMPKPGQFRARRAELVRTLKNRAEMSQRQVRNLLHSRGVGPVRELWINNSLALTASSEIIRVLSARPEVASVRLQQIVRVPEITPMQLVGAVEPNVSLIGAPGLWAKGFAGQGVTVATMDSGVDVHHPDLGPRWRGGGNSWFDPHGEHPLQPFDRNGHGTQVMGALVGGDAGGSAIGVAPAAQWIAVKIFNDAGEASEAVIHQGYQWLLDPDGIPETDDAPDVINNSWGFEVSPGVCDETVLLYRTDIQVLKSAGIAVVFSAGNTGPGANSSTAPASYPESFAVGSVGTLQSPTAISETSARGPSACDGTIFPEVVAPGYLVKTSDLTFGGLFPDSYVFVSGSSIAAPHAAGAMALLLSAKPTLTVDQLEQALLASAIDLGAAGPDNVYGHGLVDVLAAYNRIILPPQLVFEDGVPPEDDNTVDFGGVQVGTGISQNVTVRNAGGERLVISEHAGVAAPFFVEADFCSGVSLASGETCSLRIGFTPVASGAFQEMLLIYSNDPRSPAGLLLTGSGVLPPPPPPRLVIADDTGVGDDARVAFDQIPAGGTAYATFTVSNAPGAGPLRVQQVDAAGLLVPFSVANDTCSGSTLLAEQSCTVQVRFSPMAAGSYAGHLQLLSNDPVSPHRLEVAGLCNTPPPAARLHWPENRATNLPTTLVLSWSQPPDSDGDQVTNTVQLATEPHFLNPSAVTASAANHGPWPMTCTLAACLLPLGFAAGSRKRGLVLLLCCGIGLLLQVACGDSGGSRRDEQPLDPTVRTTTVSGLSAGTTYYWRVLSEDGRGGSSRSEVFSFTTRP